MLLGFISQRGLGRNVKEFRGAYNCIHFEWRSGLEKVLFAGLIVWNKEECDGLYYCFVLIMLGETKPL